MSAAWIHEQEMLTEVCHAFRKKLEFTLAITGRSLRDVNFLIIKDSV